MTKINLTTLKDDVSSVQRTQRNKRGQVIYPMALRDRAVAAFRSQNELTSANFAKSLGIHAVTFLHWLKKNPPPAMPMMPLTVVPPVSAVAGETKGRVAAKSPLSPASCLVIMTSLSDLGDVVCALRGRVEGC